MTYAPQAASLPGRVLAFFRRHQEEELSVGDIAIKFETDHARVRSALHPAVEAGALIERSQKGTHVYRLGASDAAAQLPAWPASQGLPGPGKLPRKNASPLPEDLTIKIEDGVPIPARCLLPGALTKELEGMKVGQSFEAPNPLAHRLADRARKAVGAGEARFSVRRINATTSRIWRIT